jgi:pyruvate,water dikinase
MAHAGALAETGHVFFLAKSEVAAWVQDGDHHEFVRTAGSRSREFQRLNAEHTAAPDRAYPAFLKGNQPLAEHPSQAGDRLQGHGVSPGLGRGRVVILHAAEELGRVKAGDVLVAPGVDSAWTPVFGLLSALVLEHGGQLSHAAVIAREYGLPAVAGIEGAASTLKDGEQVLVDGTLGVVERMEATKPT